MKYRDRLHGFPLLAAWATVACICLAVWAGALYLVVQAAS